MLDEFFHSTLTDLKRNQNKSFCTYSIHPKCKAWYDNSLIKSFWAYPYTRSCSHFQGRELSHSNCFTDQFNASLSLSPGEEIAGGVIKKSCLNAICVFNENKARLLPHMPALDDTMSRSMSKNVLAKKHILV